MTHNMKVIGDNLVKSIEGAFLFLGTTLCEYVAQQVNTNEDIIVYSFGYFDLNSGISHDNLFINYNKLIRGTIATYLIIPPLQPQILYDKFLNSKILDDDFICLFDWCDNYETIDGLHPNIKSIRLLEKELKNIC
jgi:hypothetical protein